MWECDFVTYEYVCVNMRCIIIIYDVCVCVCVCVSNGGYSD